MLSAFFFLTSLFFPGYDTVTPMAKPHRLLGLQAASPPPTTSTTTATTTEEIGTAPPVRYYRLDLDRVARLRAHQILRAHEGEGGGNSNSNNGGANNGDGPLSLSEFTDRWATSMPGVDTPSQDLLKVCKYTAVYQHLYIDAR